MGVTQQPLGLSSGFTVYKNTSSISTVSVVAAAAGTIKYLKVDNSANGAASYLKLYDSAGTVTPGTTDPDWIIMVAAGAIVNIPFPDNLVFANGLQERTVTAGGTAGTTSPSSAVPITIEYALS